MIDDGRLFHIDFGYILGRDPKPYPPPMKLTREMIEGMGGSASRDYQLFKSYVRTMVFFFEFELLMF